MEEIEERPLKLELLNLNKRHRLYEKNPLDLTLIDVLLVMGADKDRDKN